MTREEAITYLKVIWNRYKAEYEIERETLDAYHIAIEALSEGNVAREIATIIENEQNMRVILHNADRPTRGRKDATEEDYAYCDDCEAVEMCMWYPYDGCQFKVSRPKGEWHKTENDEMEITGYYCSVCDMPTDEPTNYCGNCGADMRSEKEYLDKTFPEHDGGEWFDITDMMTRE